jgi:hypothetical protein
MKLAVFKKPKKRPVFSYFSGQFEFFYEYFKGENRSTKIGFTPYNKVYVAMDWSAIITKEKIQRL